MATLGNAVNLGLATVEEYRGGYIVRGIEEDLVLIAEAEGIGGAWHEAGRGYFIPAIASPDKMKQLEKSTKAAAAAPAARQALAQKQGVKLFDNQRARQQRKITREIKEVYQQAMLEHAAEIAALKKAADSLPPDTDPAEYFKLLNRRKQLESVYEGLADGLANAGANAQRLMNAQLAESAAISRRVTSWQLDNMTGVQVSRFIAHGQTALALTGATSYHGKYDLKAWQGVSDKRKARQTIKQAVSRGVLTGEHPEKIARRIEGLFTGNEPLSPHKRAVRIARTETNRVMNEAAVEALRAAQAQGVKVKHKWVATLDSDTRESHRKVDGEIREIGEKFSNGLKRAGEGGAADSINCRCCMSPVVEGFTPAAPVRLNNETRELMPYMTYKEWEDTMT